MESPLITSQELTNGVRTGASTIRFARAADLPVVESLMRAAGSGVSRAAANAIRSGLLSHCVREGLDRGLDGYRAALRAGLDAETFDDVLLSCSTTLVAEQDDGLTAGVFLAPPGALIRSVLQQVNAPEDQLRLSFRGVTGVVRLQGLPVDPAAQPHGIGADVIRLARQVYSTCGYLVMYGQFEMSIAAERFYQQLGFTVCCARQAADLAAVFGRPAPVGPAAGYQLFIDPHLARSTASASGGAALI